MVIIEKTNIDLTSCLAQIGEAELYLNFPTHVLNFHKLTEYDRFRWYPTENGEISIYDIEPIDRKIDRFNT